MTLETRINKYAFDKFRPPEDVRLQQAGYEDDHVKVIARATVDIDGLRIAEVLYQVKETNTYKFVWMPPMPHPCFYADFPVHTVEAENLARQAVYDKHAEYRKLLEEHGEPMRALAAMRSPQ
jgi:hypothetical protein